MTDKGWVELYSRLVIAESIATALLEVVIDRRPDLAAVVTTRVRHHVEYATADSPDFIKAETAARVDAIAARLEQQKPALRAANHTVPMLGVV